MRTYTYDFSIQAKTENEAESKLKSLTVLASRLSEKELSKLAHIVEHQPMVLAIAKQKLGL